MSCALFGGQAEVVPPEAKLIGSGRAVLCGQAPGDSQHGNMAREVASSPQSTQVSPVPRPLPKDFSAGPKTRRRDE